MTYNTLQHGKLTSPRCNFSLPWIPHVHSLCFHPFSFFWGLKNDNIGRIDLVWANYHRAKRPNIHALTRSSCLCNCSSGVSLRFANIACRTSCQKRDQSLDYFLCLILLYCTGNNPGVTMRFPYVNECWLFNLIYLQIGYIQCTNRNGFVCFLYPKIEIQVHQLTNLEPMLSGVDGY